MTNTLYITALTLVTLPALASVTDSLPTNLIAVGISGLVGGVVRWLTLRERFWPDGVSTLVIGALSAPFLWPASAPFLEPALGRLDMEPVMKPLFGGFVFGLLGTSVISYVLEHTKIMRKNLAKKGADNE